MISKFFPLRAKSSKAAAALPDGRRIYAVGDIHGRGDLLDRLLAAIADDEAARGGAGEIIFLGDLVDRGPESAQVIERLIALKAERPETRFLAGNHEEVFLKALTGDPRSVRFFNRIGGAETILSYGVSPEDYAAADIPELGALFAAAVPDAHRQFLESFEDMIVAGDYVFVHAGIRPGVPLAEQKPSDLRWIREEFLGTKRRGEKLVVHGHTIEEDVVETAARIGIDTGAYMSGKLTAIGFEGTERWRLQVTEA